MQCVSHMSSTVPIYRKERSKRPHQSKRPGAPKIARTRKKQSKRPGAPCFIILFLKNAPGPLQTPRGVIFRSFFERKAHWGEPTTREGVRKGPAAEVERGVSQHAVGGIARVFFFLFIFIHQFKLFFFFCVSTSELNTTRPTIFFFLETPRGGAFCSIFVLKNAPGTLQTPRGRYFGIVLWNAPGAFTPFLTVVGIGKERRALIGRWGYLKSRQHPLLKQATLTPGPVPAHSRR